MPRCRPCRPRARVCSNHPPRPALLATASPDHRTTPRRRRRHRARPAIRRLRARWRTDMEDQLLAAAHDEHVNTAVVSASPFPPPKKKQGNVHSGTNYLLPLAVAHICYSVWAASLTGGSRARSSGSAQHAERGTQARLVTVAVGVVALLSPPGWLTYSQLLHGHCVPLRKTHTCSITKTQRFFWSGK